VEIPKDVLWWQRGVIYQVYPRSFCDSTGNGVGDLPGITSKLDYLADTLGVDAIWLSPFYRSPMADFGYDVADYTAVDPLFGTLADMDQLLAKAHQRDLRVIVDLVPNHTSDQHPWFIESRSARDNPKRDWYVWADARADGSPPNNWLSVFGGEAWEWDTATGQYYLHSFLKEQPDLNWRNPEAREAVFEVVRFWLERGVDGFRIDVAHYIMKDPEMRDNPPNWDLNLAIHRSLGAYDSQIHLYDKGHADVHHVYRELRRLLDSYSAERPRMSIGEVHLFDWQEWASYYGQDLDELHMPFNFHLLKVLWQVPAIRETVAGVEAAVPPGGWPNYVLGNVRHGPRPMPDTNAVGCRAPRRLFTGKHASHLVATFRRLCGDQCGAATGRSRVPAESLPAVASLSPVEPGSAMGALRGAGRDAGGQLCLYAAGRGDPGTGGAEPFRRRTDTGTSDPQWRDRAVKSPRSRGTCRAGRGEAARSRGPDHRGTPQVGRNDVPARKRRA
jgi:glycosidase